MSILDRAKEQAKAAAGQARAAAEEARAVAEARASTARSIVEAGGTPQDAAGDEHPASLTDGEGELAETSSGDGDIGLDMEADAAAAPDVRHSLPDPLGLAHQGLNRAKAGIAGVVDRIDPALLADVVIKATKLQESANLALNAKKSPYRISDILITASFPPQLTFSITRLAIDQLLDGEAPSPES